MSAPCICPPFGMAECPADVHPPRCIWDTPTEDLACPAHGKASECPGDDTLTVLAVLLVILDALGGEMSA